MLPQFRVLQYNILYYVAYKQYRWFALSLISGTVAQWHTYRIVVLTPLTRDRVVS